MSRKIEWPVEQRDPPVVPETDDEVAESAKIARPFIIVKETYYEPAGKAEGYDPDGRKILVRRSSTAGKPLSFYNETDRHEIQYGEWRWSMYSSSTIEQDMAKLALTVAHAAVEKAVRRLAVADKAVTG